jgi:hypothetical protein
MGSKSIFKGFGDPNLPFYYLSPCRSVCRLPDRQTKKPQIPVTFECVSFCERRVGRSPHKRTEEERTGDDRTAEEKRES